MGNGSNPEIAAELVAGRPLAGSAGRGRTDGLRVAYAATARRPNIAAVLAMMAVVCLLTVYLKFFRVEPDVAAADVRQVPYTLGDWTCIQEQNNDSSLMEQLKADSYILRFYQNRKTHQAVQLYLVYRRYGRREFNHNPDNCFPAGGYRLLDRSTMTLPYAGQEREVVYMRFDGSQVETDGGKVGVPDATVCYFFASGAKTEAQFLRQQLWMALERLIPNKNGWTLVRLMTPKQTTDSDAFDAQRGFMNTFGPAIQRVITTDASTAAQASAPTISTPLGS
jgi:EpsI family protein